MPRIPRLFFAVRGQLFHWIIPVGGGQFRAFLLAISRSQI